MPDVRQRRRAATRRDILAAAWRLAERDGIAGLSLRDLAAEVGMRAPSLYTYFESKAAIYDAMFAEGYAALDGALAGLPSPDGADGRAWLRDAVSRFLDFCRASVPRYQLMFTRVIPGWEPSPAAYAVSQRSWERMIEGLAAAGVAGQRAVDLWTAVTAGLAAQQLANDPGGDRWLRLVPDAVDMFLDHVEENA